MSPFEDTTEQARYDELVTEGKTPEEAHAQVVAERALVGSGTPIEGDGSTDGAPGEQVAPGTDADGNETPPAAEGEAEPVDFARDLEPGSDADQGEPSTVGEQEPERFEAPGQQRVPGSHERTGEPGNANAAAGAPEDDDAGSTVAERSERENGTA